MNITIELNPQEFNALTELLDAGVKAVGLRAAPAAAHLLGKLETAAKEAEAQKPTAGEGN